MKCAWSSAGTNIFLLPIFALMVFALASQAAIGQDYQPMQRWQWRSGQLVSGPGDPLLQVGSIQKPFVLRAWSMSHPDMAPPTITCSAESGCWRPSGHGDMGLMDALANSCNAYFMGLAGQTPLDALNGVFADAGFQGRVTGAESAIGLDPLGPRIRPSSLFKAYSKLVGLPWEREDMRQMLIHGLRQAAASGTARLGRQGYMAKTGTVQGGSPDTTIGLAIAMDGSGNGVFARQLGATGREVAAQMFAPEPRHGGMVRVRLFELLGSGTIEVKNLEGFAIPCADGFLGAGSTKKLGQGDEVGPGLLEVRVPQFNLRRVFHGRLRMNPTGKLIATMTDREYVSGVINAELTKSRPRQLQIELGAAAMRYLDRPPRHGDADVCDSTHCAWFIGRGPRVEWQTPKTAKEVAPVSAPIDDETWKAVAIAAKSPGPSLWTSHCGGEPLSPLAIWGSYPAGAAGAAPQAPQAAGAAPRAPQAAGAAPQAPQALQAAPCPRHAQPMRHWERVWDRGRLERHIGEQILSAQIVWPKGRWTLRIQTPSRSRDFDYDAAHRLLAPMAGWDALPSPADSVQLTDNKIHAKGRGSGHRVGLCLGD
jgi:hypothetical protein